MDIIFYYFFAFKNSKMIKLSLCTFKFGKKMILMENEKMKNLEMKKR